MRFIYLFLLLNFGSNQLVAQVFDICEQHSEYDFNALNNSIRLDEKGDIVFSIDNNGVVINDLKSNYYYKTKGQFWEILKAKNPNLGYLNGEIKKSNFNFQVFFIKQKLVSKTNRRHFLKDDFSFDKVEIINQQIRKYLVEDLGFKIVNPAEAIALHEGDFSSRIFFKNIYKHNALYLPFVSNLIKTKPQKFANNNTISIIYAQIENYRKDEYLHIELIINTEDFGTVKTAINVFHNWSSIDSNSFKNQKYFQNEIVESLFYQIF